MSKRDASLDVQPRMTGAQSLVGHKVAPWGLLVVGEIMSVLMRLSAFVGSSFDKIGRAHV